MLHRDLIVESLVSLYSKNTARVGFLAELHDLAGMLRAGGFISAAAEIDQARASATSVELPKDRTEIRRHLEVSLVLFDKEKGLLKEKRS